MGALTLSLLLCCKGWRNGPRWWCPLLFFFILSLFKRWNQAEEGARLTQLSFNNLPNLSVFFFFNTLFCFYVDHCGPRVVFLYFIFVVVSSHCCALCHHIASFSCQQRGKKACVNILCLSSRLNILLQCFRSLLRGREYMLIVFYLSTGICQQEVKGYIWE